MIPHMTDPLGRHWRQPSDIHLALMDDTHVLLTSRQIADLPEYSSSYPSGTYNGKCWKREGENFWYLCWYQPHPTRGKIGIGYRIVLEIESDKAPTERFVAVEIP